MSIREFQLERYFAQWEFEAPYLLSASDCETMSIGELLAIADVSLAKLAELRLGYTESQGNARARRMRQQQTMIQLTTLMGVPGANPLPGARPPGERPACRFS